MAIGQLLDYSTFHDSNVVPGNTLDAVGYNDTNCGSNTLVWPNTKITWVVDSLDLVLP